MYRKLILAAALVTFVAAPALAARTYYVSQDTRTHKCYVVTKIGKHGVQVGLSGYSMKSKARAALASASECKPKM
jgi:uncharacterized membrane protein